MNVEQFGYADKVIEFLWKNSTKIYEFSAICQELTLTPEQVQVGINIALDDDYIEIPDKPVPGRDVRYCITKAGRQFYNKHSYVKEFNKEHTQAQPHTITQTFSIKDSKNVSGIGNIAYGGTSEPKKVETFFEKHLVKFIFGVILAGITAWLTYYFSNK